MSYPHVSTNNSTRVMRELQTKPSKKSMPPREREAAAVGARRPVAVRLRAATGQPIAARHAHVVGGRRHRRPREFDLVIHDALELLHVRHAPVDGPSR